MKKKEIEVNAVFESDIINILKQLDLYDDIIAGKIKCYLCDSIITIENIHSFFVEKDEIKFCCINNICVEKFIMR